MSTTFVRGENPLKADKLNTAFSERVSRGGDTMQGFLRLAADPVQAFDAATKQYVDRFTSMGVPTGAYIGSAPPGNVLGPLWWDTNSGQLFIQYNDGTSTQWVSANSVTADQLLASNLFLPLTGGTVSGPITASGPNTVSLAGGAAGSPATITTGGPWGDLDISPALNGRLHSSLWRQFPSPSNWPEMARWDYIMTGTTGGVQTDAETHTVNTDTVHGGVQYFNFAGGPGAGATGGRTAFGMNFVQGGATTMASGEYYVAGALWATASYSAGGTATNATAGSLFAGNPSALLKTGAMYWEAVVGYEIDVGVQTGASCTYKHGLSVLFWDTDRVAGSAGKDYGIGIAAMGTCAGWDVGYAFGDAYGQWPMKAAGTMIGTIAGTGGPAYQAAWGIDFSQVTFSGGLIRGPHFSVNAQGGINLGSNFAASSTDLTRHLNLYNGVAGLCADPGGTFNIVAPANGIFVMVGGSRVSWLANTGIEATNIGGQIPGSGAFTTLSTSGAVNTSSGIHFSGVATGASDLTKHIDLHGGNTGFCVDSGGTLNYSSAGGHNIFVAGGFVGQVSSTGINSMPIGQSSASVGAFSTIEVGSAAGPTIRAGTGAATGAQPSGSIWMRTDGTPGNRLYVTSGAGTWVAVASV